MDEKISGNSGAGDNHNNNDGGENKIRVQGRVMDLVFSLL